MFAEPTNPAPLFLRRGEDKRLRAGHLWVFSNEVDIKRSPLDKFSAGDWAVVCPSCNTPHHISCWIVANAHRCWKCRTEVRLSDAAVAKEA